MRDEQREAFDFLVNLGLSPMVALGCVAKYSPQVIYDEALKVTRNSVNIRDRQEMLLKGLRQYENNI